MATSEHADEIQQRMVEMRAAFSTEHWDQVKSLFDEIIANKPGRAVRVEVSCLAARAAAATKDRPGARALLRTVSKSEYKKPVHYEFLARAFLDLKQYKDAAQACLKAEHVRSGEAA